MAESQETVTALEGQAPTPEQLEKKKKKKKDKVRSAWISFVGRIVAQLAGAAATIALGLMMVQKYQAREGGAPTLLDAPAQTVSIASARMRTAGPPSVAVLPLDNFSTDRDDSFANAMTEAVIMNLSRLDEVRVISRTSSTQSKTPQRGLPAIARELGVDFVVEGSVTKVGGRIRITVQLIDARSDEHLWAEAYERPLRDALSVQAEVAAAISEALKSVISSGRGSRTLVSRTVD
jgi:TolB-like protein